MATAAAAPAQSGARTLYRPRGPDPLRTLFRQRFPAFQVESATRIYDQEARKALSQYIVRAPLSLEKIHWDADQDTVSWKSSTSGCFQGRERHFSALDFIAQLTLHIPGRPTPADAPKDQRVSTPSSRESWAQLLAKV